MSQAVRHVVILYNRIYAAKYLLYFIKIYHNVPKNFLVSWDQNNHKLLLMNHKMKDFQTGVSYSISQSYFVTVVLLPSLS